MNVGLDIGASTTKGVILEDSIVVHQCSIQTKDAASSASETLEALLAKIGDRNAISLVAVSGGGSRRIGDTFLGFPVRKVDEIQAIGLGGLLLAKKRKGLVVSIGTGTAMVVAQEGGKKICHVGGTGVGGGTLLGLSKRMLGVDDFGALEDMASRGNANNVDLTVADIVGGPVGIVPAEATASNFGRLAGTATEDDIAAGVFNMVSQVIGVLAAMAAKAYRLEDDVILVGRPARSKMISGIISGTTELFGVRTCLPKDCEYCIAVGAAGHVSLVEKVSQ